MTDDGTTWYIHLLITVLQGEKDTVSTHSASESARTMAQERTQPQEVRASKWWQVDLHDIASFLLINS